MSNILLKQILVIKFKHYSLNFIKECFVRLIIVSHHQFIVYDFIDEHHFKFIQKDFKAHLAFQNIIIEVEVEQAWINILCILKLGHSLL